MRTAAVAAAVVALVAAAAAAVATVVAIAVVMSVTAAAAVVLKAPNNSRLPLNPRTIPVCPSTPNWAYLILFVPELVPSVPELAIVLVFAIVLDLKPKSKK